MSKHAQYHREDLLPEDRNRENEKKKDENFLNLWSYLSRRYPDIDIESKPFMELIQLKTALEGPRELRHWNSDIAPVRKR